MSRFFDVKPSFDTIPDSQLLILGLIQTFFEGSMYIFVFNWVPSLEQVSASSSLPLGYIFSSFMMSMMLGSLLYTFIVNRYLPRPAPCKSVTAPLTQAVETFFLPNSHDFPLPPPSPIPNTRSTPSTVQPAEPSSLVLYTRLSSFICFASSLSFLGSILVTNAPGRSIAFCVFEACVGMYYPVQGMLRSVLIPDEHRATVSRSVHKITWKCHTNRCVPDADILIVSHSTEHIRGRFVANWSDLSAASCSGCLFGRARILLDYHVHE